VDLLTDDAFVPESADRTFREPVIGRIVLLVIFLAIGVGWCALPLVVGPWGFLAWIVGVPCILVSVLPARGVLRGRRGGQWVVRVRRAGLALHIRSYLNADLPLEDAVVVWIPRAEIASLHAVRRKRHMPHDDGDWVAREEALEIRLTHGRTDELAHALERERCPQNRRRTHHKAHHLRVTGPDRLLLTWRSPHAALRPGLKRALEALSLHFPLEAPTDERVVDWRKLEPPGFDDLVLDLCEQGDTFTCIRLLRERHGLSLTEARRFVDELAGGQRAA
jgi:hypothetical protein